MSENQQKELNEQEISELIKIKKDKLLQLQQENKNPFEIVKYDVTNHSNEIINDFDEFDGKEVTIAGRLMTKRVMGKAAFCDIHDRYGKIQSYVRKDNIGEDKYADFKKMIDIGDVIGIKGTVFRTEKGEISIKAHELVLLSKSLKVLPEKYHGLKDQELRYRQRYLDLIVNPEVKDTFIKRSKIISGIRKFLDDREFMEVETPILQTIAGGAAAKPFITHHNALDLDMYLRISLELPLKRLIVGGCERVYEMGRVFRNEGISIKHNPEFTLLELYQAYTDYYGMMELTESLIKYLVNEILGNPIIDYQGTQLDFSKPFEKITMLDAVKKYADIDFNEIKTLEEARKIAKDNNIEFEQHHGKGDILNLFFEHFCEHRLIQPTFLLDHPVEISPLTKRKPSNPDYTERFELFIVGREFANAYSELNDPIDQMERFKHQEQLRAAGDEEANMIDDDFINALEYGMPPTGGLGIGIDRLVMLLTNAYSIRDVLLFPTMKTLDK